MGNFASVMCFLLGGGKWRGHPLYQHHLPLVKFSQFIKTRGWKIYQSFVNEDLCCYMHTYTHVAGLNLICTFIAKTLQLLPFFFFEVHVVHYSFDIHAICPGGTEKSRNFDPSKPVPEGRHFFINICFVPESLWPVKCTAFSDFWTGQIAIKTIITRLSDRSHVYCIYPTPVQRCGEVFRQ